MELTIIALLFLLFWQWWSGEEHLEDTGDELEPQLEPEYYQEDPTVEGGDLP